MSRIPAPVAQPSGPGHQDEDPNAPRGLRRIGKRYDIVVCGGGMSGIGAALTAARHGASVALLQDRPCLGGNGSKEVRVWLQGASGGANAVWFRETGLMEELLLENQYRNPTGEGEVFDAVLLELVLKQPNLDLYLNTSVYEVQLAGGSAPRGQQKIRSITALTLQAETLTTFEADYFLDCTGDGTVGYLADAPYVTGRESKAEFGESMAPDEPKKYTLGGSILFKAKNVGKPVLFEAPAFAHRFTAEDFREGRNPIPEFDRIHGGFWWVEWGGTLDTIHDNEAIKYELLKIAYGIFHYLKNDPAQKEKYANFTLEWVGAIPGKRESRRFVGDVVLREQDIVECRKWPDAVAFGGWNLDDHAPLGFFDDHVPPSIHTQIPGLYNVPLRCLYSKTVPNLLFAGRNISATHVALTSTRVMLTCAQLGEAAGACAALCVRKGLSPREVANGPAIQELQERLLRDDHYIVGVKSAEVGNLAAAAPVTCSSQLDRVALDRPTKSIALDKNRVALIPVASKRLEQAEVLLTVEQPTTLGWQLHRNDGSGLYIPKETVAEGSVVLQPGGAQWVTLPVNVAITQRGWHMLELKANPAVHWHAQDGRLPGVKAFQDVGIHKSPRHFNAHSRLQKLGGWVPCVRLPEDRAVYGPANVTNGYGRPYQLPNLWISAPTNFERPEWLEVDFGQPLAVREVQFLFDSDLDRHLTSMWLPMPHACEPDLVKDYDVQLRVNGAWQTVKEVRGNRLRRNVWVLDKRYQADAVRLEVKATHGTPRAQVYEVRAYA
ncbi:MAG: FAD-dependent oxidoreductase [Planctomycetes bacterium]|nr:FAD-dependent oxidoreductase [Planctomycetota bacterium]